MLYYLLYPLRELWFGFNVFKYLTFRAAMAALTAFLIAIIWGPAIISWLRTLKFGQHIRRDHVESLYQKHQHKQGTPTMGGILIIAAIVGATLLWGDPLNKYVLTCLSVFIFLGFVGFMDDYLKIKHKHNRGLRARTKFLCQIACGLAVAGFVLYCTPIPRTIHLPFLKEVGIDIGVGYLLFVILVLTGSSNAVNLTDGLDGLAIGCTIIAALVYSLLSYVAGHARFSEYLNIYYLQGGGELAVFCAAIVGAGLGFLWFNSHPANVFMGDTGSLALGGAIGTVAILIKKELLLFIVGGVFVMEALSVILQVTWFKTTKKRLFKMSPIHHHFQEIGWDESKITIRFWIVAIILALFSLATLKLQ